MFGKREVMKSGAMRITVIVGLWDWKVSLEKHLQSPKHLLGLK